MVLNTFERVTILNILPQEGNIITLKILRKLRESLSFSEEEHKDLGLRIEDGLIYWMQDKDRPKEVEIGPKAFEIISNELNALNQKNKLTEAHIDIFDKFCKEA